MSTIPARDLINNVRKDYESFFKKTLQKSNDYEKFGMTDARRDYFMLITVLNVWFLIQFDDSFGTQNKLSGKISKYLTLSGSDFSMFVEQFDRINRVSYITHFMFCAEHFVKALLSKLNQPISKKYYPDTKNLLDFLNKNTGDNHKILTLPAQVRNALHNDGYTNFDIDVTLRGNNFLANRGGQITFAGWPEIYIMLDELVDLLTDLLDNTRINQESFIARFH